MAFRDAAHQLEGPEGIKAPAVIGAKLFAVFGLGNLPDGLHESAGRGAVGADEEDIFSFRKVRLRVFQELLGKGVVVNTGGKADPVIVGQVGGGILCDIDQVNVMLRRDGVKQLFCVSMV